jgi:N-acetylneuraminic acid mutarotase
MRQISGRCLVFVTALGLAGCGTSMIGKGALPGTTGASTTSSSRAESGWLRYPDAPTARFGAASATSGFRLLVIGGYDDGLSRLGAVEQFTAFDKWETLPPLPSRRSSACAANVPSERILVFGGAVASSVATQPLGTVERLSLATRTWDRLAEMPTPRWGAGAAAHGLQVYVAGGSSWGNPVAAFERYDALGNSWQRLADVPTAREAAAVAMLGQRVVVAGGRDRGTVLGQVDLFNPETGKWYQGAPMPTPRSHAGYLAYGHHLFVVGGSTANGASAAVESFDLASNSWTRHAPLPEASSNLVAAKLGARLVVTGGLGEGGKATARTYGTAFPF